MQNWDNMQAAATYEQHNNNNNNWYNSMLAQTEIKTEPDTESRMHEQQTVMTTTSNATMTMKHKSSATSDVMSHLENYLRQQQQQQVQQQPQTPQQQQMSTVDALNAAMTPSPSNTDSMQQLVYDSGMQTQLLQQQQYQQQFQQAQQAAAHNQVTSTTPHLPLGFNPLTPPGLPTAIIPSITHFYHQQQQHQHHSASNNARHSGQQTPSPQPLHALTHTHAHMLQQPSTPMDSSEKLQSALTPRNTPPMDITPPKSPTKSQIAHLAEAMHMQQQQQQQHEKQQQEQDAQSDTSDDMKYSTGELDDEKMIREPIYNSHGKIKNYKCKSCGLIAITKVLFWEHARTHMKPEKILQCPKCPFVTELKHHLEYHIRKHKNLKPFQCDKCSYTCVNKSMLNSHRKSHSSVYQYRCADCDYATKYCHSFKLHLRKYDHKPGLVLDEEGLPNPSVVIDVYGTRRGPKSKGGAGANKRSNSHTSLDRLHAPKSMQHCQENSGTEFKLSASQLSAALQSFSMPTQQQQQQQHHQQHQMPVSPAKSPSSLSSSSELQATRGLSQQQQQMHALTHATQAKLQRQPGMQQNLKHLNPTQASSEHTDTKSSMSSLLPPLATILQQNPNMAFFPYWNLNLQMLAAQQQAAALAQMPTNMREKALQELQNLHNNKETYLVRSPTQHAADNEVSDNDADDDDADDDDDQSDDRKSTDSAMDLSQGSPVKEDIEQQQRRTPAACMKLHDESNDTPIVSVNGAARRKGRVLKLDATLHVKSASAESLVSEEETIKKSAHEHASASQASSPIPNRTTHKREQEEEEEEVVVGSSNACAAPIAMDMDSAELAVNEHLTKPVSAACTSSTSTNSTASSSGNSSNGSSSTASQTSTTGNGPPALGTMYECKYCDIYFKDAVLYTIHMGYHSCDDVFKCNMCGEKCDGPVGLFVHMARNAHS